MADLQAQQMVYGQDGARPDGESDPGGDIELELCALDLEDPEVTAQVSEPWGRH